MKVFFKRLSAILLILVMIAAIGCTNKNNQKNSDYTNTLNSTLESVNNMLPDFNEMLTHCFGSVNMNGDYNDDSVKIDLSNPNIIKDSVSYSNGELIISKAGTYILSGTLNDGRIVVDAGDDDSVQLVLLNASITSYASSAIKLKNASTVILTLPKNSKNRISTVLPSLTTAEDSDSTNTHAALSSNCNLIINGSGSIEIDASNGNAIKCNQSLCLCGGAYSIVSTKNGIKVKDALYAVNAALSINSETNGINVESKAEEGGINILNGSYSIEAKEDGIKTDGNLRIYNGSYLIKTGDGSASVTLASDADDANRNPWGDVHSGETNDTSQKGFHVGKEFAIANGSFSIDSVDDCIHSGGDIGILGGEFNLRSGDDAIHSDTNIMIVAGNFNIPYCYEGIEGITVTINSGEYNIVSSDDGINAANGDTESVGHKDHFTPDDSCFIIINGGNVTIKSEGDCMDSNGKIIINGGTLRLTCGGNGNTAIDATGDYINNGGSVTTNDGSEQDGGANRPGGPGRKPEGGFGKLPNGDPGGMGGSAPDGTPPAGLPNGTPPAGLPNGDPGGMGGSAPDGTPPAGLPNGNFN